MPKRCIFADTVTNDEEEIEDENLNNYSYYC